jgi:hypothetical protein
MRDLHRHSGTMATFPDYALRGKWDPAGVALQLVFYPDTAANRDKKSPSMAQEY